MTDYDRIAKIIRFLDGHHEEQPDLDTLAKHVGLSSSLFHRLFSAWAGITAKDFLQCLTMSHARESLKQGRSVLDTALNAGLSGPSRLHGLCIKLEAASPGEIKAGGEGWIINAGYADTPFGTALLAESPRGLCYLSFSDVPEDTASWNDLLVNWPKAQIKRDDEHARKLSASIFVKGAPPLHPLKLYVKGTDFQVRVWQALLQIPEGKLLSYGDLAGWIGNPKASRAVGTAVGKNPIAYLIPCHRVIRETGAIGGYRWGISRKKAMLASEYIGNSENKLNP